MTEQVIEQSQEAEPTSGVQEALKQVVDTIEPQTSPEVKKNIFKSIVDGEEMVFDLDDPKQSEKLRTLVQKESTSQKRMRDASEKEKNLLERERQISEIVEMIEKDPRHYLKTRNVNVPELAASILEEFLQEQEKSPEIKAQEEKDKKLKSYEEELQKLKKEKEEIEVAKLRNQTMIEIDQEITDALKKHPDIPKSKYVVGRIAAYLKDALNNGYHDVTVEDVIPFVKRRFHEEAKEIIASMHSNGIDGLENFLGQDMVSALRKAKKIKAQEEVQKNMISEIKGNTKAKEVKIPEANKKVSLSQWLRQK